VIPLVAANVIPPAAASASTCIAANVIPRVAASVAPLVAAGVEAPAAATVVAGAAANEVISSAINVMEAVVAGQAGAEQSGEVRVDKGKRPMVETDEKNYRTDEEGDEEVNLGTDDLHFVLNRMFETRKLYMSNQEIFINVPCTF
jgi:hypothetical protein